ncbi:MAG: hypothetical protein QOC64_3573 [Solirubrobacteraceae bacterium]|nr:hypothetical protein [Solirubrobacteraceae bacterium]
MNVFAQNSIFTPAPRFARDEPNPAVFSGSPQQVAAYLSPRMVARTHTMALVSAELRTMARNQTPNANIRFELADSTSVTVRP